MTGRLEGKVALVTGAGSVGPGWGNGKAAAVLFAREGARILAADIHADAAEETRGLIEGEGGECAVVTADVTDTTSVKAMVDACRERFGRIDVLHNNVGGSAPGDPVAMDEAVWDAQIALNLTSVFLTCKHVLPIMVEQGAGAIVNVSSLAGVRYFGRDNIAYTAAKAGLHKFTEQIAVKYAPQNIRANTVIAGLMHTPLVEARLMSQYGDGDRQAFLDERNALVPMGRMGDAWDVARAALFLASDEAGYVTGAQILVDGGITAKCN
jgi:NAD(P)-dependent dehydrogenase (short-subunit alcohol dehydrogenase family)